MNLFKESNKTRFDNLCRLAMLSRPNTGEDGIGTLGEKRMHAIIKFYLCPDQSMHEVKLEGTRFVSDVRVGNHVYEVQTGSFFPMKKKIDYYLSKTDCTVTVVHPIPVIRWMSRVDPVSMEISPRRRVPKRGRAEDLLPQLYYLADHLQNPRLRFRLLFLETHDFLLTDPKHPKKRGSHYERIPLSLLDEVEFGTPGDYLCLLPEALPHHFTVKDFSVLTKLRGRNAYSAVRALAAIGVISPAEPIGRSMAFTHANPHNTL